MKGMGNMGKLMKQAQEMQAKMGRVQEELEATQLEASAGGGAVTVVMNGKQVMLSIRLKPEAVNAEDVEILEDMILAAYGEARKKAEDLAQAELAKVTGGLPPGLL